MHTPHGGQRAAQLLLRGEFLRERRIHGNESLFEGMVPCDVDARSCHSCTTGAELLGDHVVWQVRLAVIVIGWNLRLDWQRFGLPSHFNLFAERREDPNAP